MSTSIQHVSGTLLNASPPAIRARLIDGRSNRSDDSALNARVSIRRKASCALRIALSPSHGVDPWAAVPTRWRRTASTPFASTPICRSVGSPVIAKSARRPRLTRTSVDRLSTSADSSSGTQSRRRWTARWGGVPHREHHPRKRALHVVGAPPEQAITLDPRLELSRAGRDDIEMAVEDDRLGRPGGPTSAAGPAGRCGRSRRPGCRSSRATP